MAYLDSIDTSFAPRSKVIFKDEQKTVIWETLQSNGEPVVLKLYRHRGIVNTIRGRMIKYRAEREYERFRHLESWSVPCTRPVDWISGYSHEHGNYEVLATTLVPRAQRLDTYLRQRRSCDLRQLFASVRRMHESGFRHHALYARNILITGNGSNKDDFIICDVPRSRVFPRSLVGTRMAMLDVADLIASLTEHDVPVDSTTLDTFGLSPAEQKRLSTMINGYRKERLYRVARDIESRVKHFAACFAAVLTGRLRTLR